MYPHSRIDVHPFVQSMNYQMGKSFILEFGTFNTCKLSLVLTENAISIINHVIKQIKELAPLLNSQYSSADESLGIPGKHINLVMNSISDHENKMRTDMIPYTHQISFDRFSRHGSKTSNVCKCSIDYCDRCSSKSDYTSVALPRKLILPLMNYASERIDL